MKRGTRRSLALEGLENRQCFSVDIGALLASLDVPEDVIKIVRHNYEQPTDVNVDGVTSPVDALSVINELNQKSSTIISSMMVDTNGDRIVSPIDALLVINQLNLQASGTENGADEGTSPTAEEDTQTRDLITETIVDSQMAEESIATLLGRLRDLGLIDLGSLDLGSINFDLLDGGLHDAVDSASTDLTSIDLSSIDWSSIDLGSLDLESLGLGTIDEALLSRIATFSATIGRTYDPTDDNGNGFFLSAEDAAPLSTSIEAELRKQLKLDDTASIQVAVFAGGDEIQSGTWRYLTAEGISIWGNWRKTPDELRLFLSNVEEENRIYGQYPDGSFLYFSWLDDEPVGFYFTPLNSSGVENPVPIERYTDYFNGIPGAEAADFSGSIDAFFGDFKAFDGVQPIEKLLRDLYAIQLKWNAELELV